MWRCFCDVLRPDEDARCKHCGATPESAAFTRMMRHPYTNLLLRKLRERVQAGHNPEYSPICDEHAEVMSEWLRVPESDYVDKKDCVWCAMARRAELRNRRVAR